MKPEVTRRDVVGKVKASLEQLGFDDIGTRRGRLPQTFHIDGKFAIGRGTVSQGEVDFETLRKIHDEVYTLGRMHGKRRVHVSYGTYSPKAINFAQGKKIELYVFDQNGDLTTPTTLRSKLASSRVFRVLSRLVVLATIGFIVLCAASWIISNWGRRGFDINISSEAVIAILTLLSMAILSAIYRAFAGDDKKK